MTRKRIPYNAIMYKCTFLYINSVYTFMKDFNVLVKASVARVMLSMALFLLFAV